MLLAEVDPGALFGEAPEGKINARKEADSASQMPLTHSFLLQPRPKSES